MGRFGLGGDHHAGCQLVETVDDAGTLDAANAGQLAFAMEKERIDQCAIPAAGRRVNGHA